MARERKLLKPDGRAANALKHGARSDAPVVGDEDPAEWQQHLKDFTDSLRPTNAAEKALVYRAALACWKPNRTSVASP